MIAIRSTFERSYNDIKYNTIPIGMLHNIQTVHNLKIKWNNRKDYQTHKYNAE